MPSRPLPTTDIFNNQDSAILLLAIIKSPSPDQGCKPSFSYRNCGVPIAVMTYGHWSNGGKTQIAHELETYARCVSLSHSKNSDKNDTSYSRQYCQVQEDRKEVTCIAITENHFIIYKFIRDGSSIRYPLRNLHYDYCPRIIVPLNSYTLYTISPIRRNQL